MKAIGLILTGLLFAGLFTAKVAASSVAVDSPVATSNPDSAAPQHRYSWYRRHYRRHYQRHHGQHHRTTAPVPEPVTLSLLGLGGMGLAYSSRRKKRKQGLDQPR